MRRQNYESFVLILRVCVSVMARPRYVVTKKNLRKIKKKNNNYNVIARNLKKQFIVNYKRNINFWMYVMKFIDN